jgi:hypothetical protein
MKKLNPIILLIFTCFLFQSGYSFQANTTSWHAKWIWQEADGPENTWLNLRKTISLDAKPAKAITRIAAENKYWLYVNGTLVVRDGGMDLRPDLTNTYYDSLDIAEYLKPGDNIIAVLVWYKGGHNGYSQHMVNKGGFLFESHLTGTKETEILSDNTWKVREHPSFVRTPQQQQWNDYKWVEYPVVYDAQVNASNWIQITYEDRNWKPAVVKAAALEAPWNNLVNRTIPLLKNFKPIILKNYPSTISSDTTFTIDIGKNIQGYLYLRMDAGAGDTILIRSNEWYTETYITKGRIQDYTTYQWQNTSGKLWNKHCIELSFRNVKRPVKLTNVEFKPTGYNTEVTGSFKSNNERLNKLWHKSLNTSYVCMHDQFYDCPDRERGQWWGDVSEQILYSFYLYDGSASLLAKKGIRELMYTQKPNGSLYTTAPGSRFHLPDQNIAGVNSIGDYFMYTGDTALVRELYPRIARYVKDYLSKTMNNDGMLVFQDSVWNWIDWGDSLDIKKGSVNAVNNALFIRLMETLKILAPAAGASGDVSYYDGLQKKVKENFNKYFWNSKNNAYSFHRNGDTLSAVCDDRSNAWAVLAGVVDKEKLDGVLEVLKNKLFASPYQERYIEEAMFVMGKPEEAVERMLKYYKPDIDSWSETMWERMGNNSTNNHAWAASPSYLLGAFAAGMKPVKPGFTEFEVMPRMSGLTEISTEVHSPKGMIKVFEELKKNKFMLNVTVPEGTTAQIGIPKIKQWKTISVNGKVIWKNSKIINWIPELKGTGEDDSFIRLKIKPGSWKFEAGL